jgi:hypothetical protein
MVLRLRGFVFEDTMSNTDFRITTDALDHPKIVKLERICGKEGIICLLRLWAFTARYHPRGFLNDMTGDDIEIAAKWTGKLGLLIESLVELKLIDVTDNRYSIHDWQEHNSYAYHAPERSRKAKDASVKRWQCYENASSNATGNAQSNAPSPSPNPTPKPEESKSHCEPKSGSPIKKSLEEKKTEPCYLWLQFYRSEFEKRYKTKPVLTKGDCINAQKQYKTALHAGNSDDDIRQVTRSYLNDNSEFYRGHKPHLLFKHFDRIKDQAGEFKKEKYDPEQKARVEKALGRKLS